MISAVIFDMDGTLIDTEVVSQKAWAVALRQGGLPGDTGYISRGFIGRSVASITPELAELLGGLPQAEQAYLVHNQTFVELSDAELKPKPGARQTVVALRGRGYKVGLATSTYRGPCDRRLARFGMEDIFDAKTCGDEINRGKPAPDIFLQAAAALGADPAECLVVEDSPNGVRAGHAAGMHVVFIPDLVELPQSLLALCDAKLSSLGELEGWLSKRETGQSSAIIGT